MRKPPTTLPTRERILRLALALLNGEGADRATTRRIAELVGINEGNLYYHFRTKEALFMALFERFEADAVALLRPERTDYQRTLQQWFELTWSYRFLFRDVLAVQAAAPALRPALRPMSRGLVGAMSEIVARMERDGLLSVPAGERERLLANVAIVSTYWVSFLDMQRGVGRMTRPHLLWGYAQVRSLFAPYLTSAATAAFAPKADASSERSL